MTRPLTPANPRPTARRASFVIVFGEGAERWSFPDPGHPIVDEAQHRVRYGQPLEQCNGDALVLADVVSALHYLLYTCPSSKLACQKLSAMRAALRKLPAPPDRPRAEREADRIRAELGVEELERAQSAEPSPPQSDCYPLATLHHAEVGGPQDGTSKRDAGHPAAAGLAPSTSADR